MFRHSFQQPRSAQSDAVSEASTDGDEGCATSCLKKSKFSRSARNKTKSSLCRNFSEKGYCPYGQKCQFAHGIEELKCNTSENSYKTKPCNSYWKKGFCPYGLRCNFSHSVLEAEYPASRELETPATGSFREVFYEGRKVGESRLATILE